MQARVEDVNRAVKQLEDSRHPRTKEVKDCQARLNKRCVESFEEPQGHSHTLFKRINKVDEMFQVGGLQSHGGGQEEEGGFCC